MFCNNCGTELPDGSKFCDVCGSRLDGPVNTQTDSQPVQPQPQPQYQQPQPQYQQQYQQPQPQYQQQYQASYQQQVYTNGAPAEEKSKKGLIIALVSIVGVLFLIAIGVIVWFFADRMSHASSPKEKVATEETVNNEDQVTPASEQPPETTPIATSTPTPTPTPTLTQEPVEKEKNSAGKDDINGLSDEDAKELAQYLATDDVAHPDYDFYFAESALADGKNNIDTLFDNPGAIAIRNPSLVEGGWKGYMQSMPEFYDVGEEAPSQRYINVNIHSVGDKVKVKLQWGFFVSKGPNGTEMYEDYTDDYSGKWNNDYSGFSAELVEIKKIIYLKGDKEDEEFALGEFTWESGEKDYLVLCRPNDYNMSADTSSGNTMGNGSGSVDSKSSQYDEIVEKARKKSGAPAAELDSIDPDGTLNIHLYEDTGGHTATVDWYYINPDTLKGENLLGDPVDLSK